MQKEELAFTPAWKQALLVARREVSPVELTTLYLERIERLDPVLHAYITVCADHALDAARRAEERAAAGGDLPPFLGVPVSVKDVEATRGIRTTLGSPAFRDHVPDEDSVVAERVRKSGAVLIGKNNTPELGVSDGQLTVNDLVGRCVAANQQRFPGRLQWNDKAPVGQFRSVNQRNRAESSPRQAMRVRNGHTSASLVRALDALRDPPRQRVQTLQALDDVRFQAERLEPLRFLGHESLQQMGAHPVRVGVEGVFRLPHLPGDGRVIGGHSA